MLGWSSGGPEDETHCPSDAVIDGMDEGLIPGECKGEKKEKRVMQVMQEMLKVNVVLASLKLRST